jgi:L-alanine-DL-glutamate epimerase-like enolase superfamily enzyme
MEASAAPISRLDVSAFTVPLEEPETDGTLGWDSTTAVVVQAAAAGERGIGWTYGSAACATLVDELLAEAVLGRDALDVPGAWEAMVRAIRNQGRPGIASMSIAAVDTALWDLKAKLVGLPLHALLGALRHEVPIYGSGGFTSLSDRALREQAEGWVRELGVHQVKIKVGLDRGSREDRDVERVAVVREAIGDRASLFVDANGAYGRAQAGRVGRRLEDLGVVWFEEPVSSDDLQGLGIVRDATSIDVAAGEYGYDLASFARLAPVVDVLQADVTRCAGITEWLRVAAVAAAYGLEISGHTAQSLHVAPACAVPNLRHLEYFADHARVERLLFDGTLDPRDGVVRPDPTRTGNGLELRTTDAERFAV